MPFIEPQKQQHDDNLNAELEKDVVMLALFVMVKIINI
jgi:hypothetical protein